MSKHIKKIVILLFIIITVYYLTSCSGVSAHSSSDVVLTDPAFTEPDDNLPGLGVEDENDYSNIAAYTEFTEYTKDVESIKCTIIDNNPGKGFYFFPIPFIEHLTADKWIRLRYEPIDLDYESRWAYCAIEGNTTKPNSTLVIFFPKYLVNELVMGKYRLVVFVSDQIVYAPFIIK